MKHRRDDLRLSPIDRLRIGMRGRGCLATAGLALVATVLLTVWLFVRQQALPIEKEEAEIVRFGVHPDVDGAHMFAIVRTAGGLIDQVDVSQRAVFRCRPGDRIRLIRQGGALSVDSYACPSR